MKRRGVLGLLGGGLVSAPAMATQAMSHLGMGAAAISGTAINSEPTSGPWYSGYDSIPTSSGIEYDHLRYLNEELSRTLGMDRDTKLEHAGQVTALDPDLATNRSFSLSAKIRFQEERNLARWQLHRTKSLKRQIAEHLANQVR